MARKHRPGFRSCYHCKESIPSRCKKCPECGNRIDPKKAKAFKEKEERKRNRLPIGMRKYALAMGRRNNLVVAPSGPCPIALRKKSVKHIREWAQDVVGVGIRHGKLYMPQALKYFGRNFFDPSSSKYRRFCHVIDKWANEIIAGVREKKDEETIEA